MTDYRFVRVALDPPVGVLTLARPNVHNALSTAMAAEIARACGELAGAPGVNAVLLCAEGDRAFCVGADLKERASFRDEDMAAQRPVFRDCFDSIAGLPQPSVAAVHGFALGGGFELALACDLIVADETVVVGLPEVGIGLVPGGGGTQRLLRRCGSGRTADLVLTGRRVPVEEAARLGLVDRVVPAGRARDEAARLATRIAGNSPVATRAAKRALRNGAGLDLSAALDVEDAAWRTAAFSADRREGIVSFTEKRKPRWPSAEGPTSRPGR